MNLIEGGTGNTAKESVDNPAHGLA